MLFVNVVLLTSLKIFLISSTLQKMSLFSPRNVLGSLGWDNNNDLLNSQSGVVGSFSSGGCCDSGVDTAAWLALLVGKTLFIKMKMTYYFTQISNK